MNLRQFQPPQNNNGQPPHFYNDQTEQYGNGQPPFYPGQYGNMEPPQYNTQPPPYPGQFAYPLNQLPQSPHHLRSFWQWYKAQKPIAKISSTVGLFS